MSELKFTCPACGQHMQCEKAYVGDKTSCPTCNAELRVPFSHTPIESKTQLPRAELVSAPAGPLPDANIAEPSPFTEASVPLAPPQAKEISEHSNVEPTCICPVCQSELRLPQKTKSSTPPVAELVHQGTKEPDRENPTEAKPESLPAREQHIAAAREANPVSLYPAMKPRLSYILSGGESVAPKDENSPKKSPGNVPPSPDTFVE